MPGNNASETEASLTRILAPLGLPLLVKPEWTDLNYGTTYTVSYFLIGSQILFITARGRPTLDDLERITAFERGLIRSALPARTPFIRIEDWSKLQAPSRGAREYYIRHLIEEPDLIGQIYTRLPIFFHIPMKVARRTHSVTFPILITDTYDDAMQKAISLLPGAATGATKGAGPMPSSGANVLRHPRWRFEQAGFSLSFEVIDSRILHGQSNGSLGVEQVQPALRLQEQVLEEAGLAGKPFSLLLGVGDAKNFSPRARQPYVSGLLEFHARHPITSATLYGLNRVLKAAVNMYRPFMPFPVNLAADLPTALALITGVPARTGSRVFRKDHRSEKAAAVCPAIAAVSRRAGLGAGFQAGSLSPGSVPPLHPGFRCHPTAEVGIR